MLTTFLSDVKDFRRSQGQRYKLHQTLLFSFLAICCNANTYRQVRLFIHTNFDKLSSRFNLDWKAVPHHTTIRNHIKGVCQMNWKLLFVPLLNTCCLRMLSWIKCITTLRQMVKSFAVVMMKLLESVPYKVFHFSMLPVALYWAK